MTTKENQLTENQYNRCNKTYKLLKKFMTLKNQTDEMFSKIGMHEIPDGCEGFYETFEEKVNENYDECYKNLVTDYDLLVREVDHDHDVVTALSRLHYYLFSLGFFGNENFYEEKWSLEVNNIVENYINKIGKSLTK